MSALDSSVTLEDVFVVVGMKRVPLAPELAGYLSLEIADGTDAGSGDVDPKTVFISEEGTVALVRPKKDVVTGEAESSIRHLLNRLLDASGSSTPALTAAAKRKPGNGLPALVEELEAALIPVNRAAGRRALARLARETKRVMMGVGRNASAPPPPPPKKFEPDEAVTVPRKVNPVSDAPRPAAPLPPPPGTKESKPPPPPPPPAREKLFGGDEVESLLSTFEVSSSGDQKQMSRDLKAIAGLSPTPPPPNAKTIDDLVKDVGKDFPKVPLSSRNPLATPDQPAVAALPPPTPPPPPIPAPTPQAPAVAGGDLDGVEALLALADATGGPLAPPLPPPGFQPKSAPPPPVSAPPVSPFSLAPSAPPPPMAPPISAPPPVAARVASPPAATPPAPAAASGRHRKVSDPPPPERPRRTSGSSKAKGQPRAPRTAFFLVLFLLAVLVGGVGFIWVKAPHFFTGKKKPMPTASVAPSASAPPAPKCKVTLVVSDAPVNAEILLRMGQAPLDVERMPVGTRLEFVGTAEGYAPRRAVVKSEATWDKGADGKPRIDVPMQLDPSKAKPGTVDAWPAAEPGSQVGGAGSPGTVHVISNVRGAEIWLLAGVGPEARIEQLRCDGDIDVLLAGPSQLRKRLHVAEKEISAATADPQGNRTVSVSAK